MPSPSKHSSHSSSGKHKSKSSSASSSSSSSSSRHRASSSSQDPTTELRFFMYSDPAEAKNPDNKKLVRSHVARASHARSRRERESGESSNSSYTAGSSTQAYETSPSNEYMYFDNDMGMVDATATSYSSAISFGQTASYSSTSYSSSPHLSASGQLSPWDEHLLHHYNNVLVPSRHSPCDHPSHPIDVAAYRRGMTGPWISFCQTDPGLLQGIFQASCQSLAKLHRRSGNTKDADMYAQRALHYRGECLRYMREAMPAPGQQVTDNVIGIALLLAFNEYMAGDHREAQQHMVACEYMVTMAGGYHYLGLGGFLAQLIQWFKLELDQAIGHSSKSHGKRRS